MYSEVRTVEADQILNVGFFTNSIKEFLLGGVTGVFVRKTAVWTLKTPGRSLDMEQKTTNLQSTEETENIAR